MAVRPRTASVPRQRELQHEAVLSFMASSRPGFEQMSIPDAPSSVDAGEKRRAKRADEEQTEAFRDVAAATEKLSRRVDEMIRTQRASDREASARAAKEERERRSSERQSTRPGHLLRNTNNNIFLGLDRLDEIERQLRNPSSPSSAGPINPTQRVPASIRNKMRGLLGPNAAYTPRPYASPYERRLAASNRRERILERRLAGDRRKEDPLLLYHANKALVADLPDDMSSYDRMRYGQDGNRERRGEDRLLRNQRLRGSEGLFHRYALRLPVFNRLDRPGYEGMPLGDRFRALMGEKRRAHTERFLDYARARASAVGGIPNRARLAARMAGRALSGGPNSGQPLSQGGGWLSNLALLPILSAASPLLALGAGAMYLNRGNDGEGGGLLSSLGNGVMKGVGALSPGYSVGKGLFDPESVLGQGRTSIRDRLSSAFGSLVSPFAPSGLSKWLAGPGNSPANPSGAVVPMPGTAASPVPPSTPSLQDERIDTERARRRIMQESLNKGEDPGPKIEALRKAEEERRRNKAMAMLLSQQNGAVVNPTPDGVVVGGRRPSIGPSGSREFPLYDNSPAAQETRRRAANPAAPAVPAVTVDTSNIGPLVSPAGAPVNPYANVEYPDYSNGGKDRYNKSIPASVRHNNPGAMYPASWMKDFGMMGHDIIGGGHPIAHFPTAVHGAAANLNLMDRKYAGKDLGAFIRMWSGNNSSQAYRDHVAKQVGIPNNAVITREMIRDPEVGWKILKAQSEWEKGSKGPKMILTDDQWRAAHRMFLEKRGIVPAGAPALPSQASEESLQRAQRYLEEVAKRTDLAEEDKAKLKTQMEQIKAKLDEVRKKASSAVPGRPPEQRVVDSPEQNSTTPSGVPGIGFGRKPAGVPTSPVPAPPVIASDSPFNSSLDMFRRGPITPEDALRAPPPAIFSGATPASPLPGTVVEHPSLHGITGQPQSPAPAVRVAPAEAPVKDDTGPSPMEFDGGSPGGPADNTGAGSGFNNGEAGDIESIGTYTDLDEMPAGRSVMNEKI